MSGILQDPKSGSLLAPLKPHFNEREAQLMQGLIKNLMTRPDHVAYIQLLLKKYFTVLHISQPTCICLVFKGLPVKVITLIQEATLGDEKTLLLFLGDIGVNQYRFCSGSMLNLK